MRRRRRRKWRAGDEVQEQLLKMLPPKIMQLSIIPA